MNIVTKQIYENLRRLNANLYSRYRAGKITLEQYGAGIEGMAEMSQEKFSSRGMDYISGRRRWFAAEQKRVKEEQARAAADRERRAFLQRGGRMSTIYTGKGALQMLAPANRQTLGG